MTDDVRVFEYFSMGHCWSTSMGATRLMVLINFLVLVFFAWRCDGGDGDGGVLARTPNSYPWHTGVNLAGSG